LFVAREYIERWEHYRQRVWTCRYTGRTGLTYEEALVSEADATHLSLQLPEEQLTEMALLMHKFVGGLEALVEHVQKHFRDTAKSGKTTPTKAIIKRTLVCVCVCVCVCVNVLLMVDCVCVRAQRW
jgi:hypothetical protein